MPKEPITIAARCIAPEGTTYGLIREIYMRDQRGVDPDWLVATLVYRHAPDHAEQKPWRLCYDDGWITSASADDRYEDEELEFRTPQAALKHVENEFRFSVRRETSARVVVLWDTTPLVTPVTDAMFKQHLRDITDYWGGEALMSEEQMDELDEDDMDRKLRDMNHAAVTKGLPPNDYDEDRGTGVSLSAATIQRLRTKHAAIAARVRAEAPVGKGKS